jgi:hypothetical protein
MGGDPGIAPWRTSINFFVSVPTRVVDLASDVDVL